MPWSARAGLMTEASWQMLDSCVSVVPTVSDVPPPDMWEDEATAESKEICIQHWHRSPIEHNQIITRLGSEVNQPRDDILVRGNLAKITHRDSPFNRRR